ncbi:MAG: hypothetical protein HN975_18540 [Anaerolineae bacterium]|nr:hypothetical protein [Anaerolineae bacterium]
MNILILEDEVLDAELEIAMMQRAGYDCHWQRVVSEVDFLNAIDSSRFDLILADGFGA